MRIAIVGLALLALTAPALAQQSEAAPGARAERVWRWVDPDREPFQPWHTDAEAQARMYAQADGDMRAIVGIPLPQPVEVVLSPSFGFFFVTMEVGAKDGSLLLDTSVSRAMEQLSFVTKAERKPTTVSADWRGEPGSALSFAHGVYAPKHVKRMIVLNCDLTAEQAERALRHELVHAMQDEAFGFKDFFAFPEITVDQKWARQAIEEGYATLIAEPTEARVSLDELASADWTLQMSGLVYGAGRRLVESVGERAGSRRELLDLLFQHPPATTREVLHPELYQHLLDSGTPLELPSPEGFVALRDMLLAAMSSTGHGAAWRSRLGEFGLRCVLSELGLSADRVDELAPAWRNDELINHDDWREPSATTVVWSLSTPEAAEALDAALGQLISARSAKLEPVPMRLAGQAIQGHASLGAAGWPDAFIVRSGESVGLVVGDGLGALVETVRKSAAPER
jgi:hypothetical protein